MKERAEQLIANLLARPEKFDKSGAAYLLLQEYFDGYPLETLSPLLRHSSYFVQRTAVWVTSELGIEASPLLLDVLPILESGDQFLSYHALDIIAVCSCGELTRYFSRVPRMLVNSDEVLRIRAMNLIGNTGLKGMRAILGSTSSDLWGDHLEYLERIVSTVSEKQGETVEKMLGGDSFLEQKYGAILARWVVREQPELILIAADNNHEDVRRYAMGVVRRHKEYFEYEN